jgi:hypothetical protein
MIIEFDTLIRILTEHGSWGSTSPTEALYVKFGNGKREVKDTVTYHTRDGTLVAIDIDENDLVLGIELV